jgi:hypothetical protein
MVAAVGEDAAAREMRKHVAWYVKGLPHSARVREQVNRTRTVGEMAGLLRAYLEELESSSAAAPEGRPGDAPRRPAGEGALAAG